MVIVMFGNNRNPLYAKYFKQQGFFTQIYSVFTHTPTVSMGGIGNDMGVFWREVLVK